MSECKVVLVFRRYEEFWRFCFSECREFKLGCADRSKKIVEQEPPKEALGILTTLQGLGFNDQLLGSEKYVLEKLKVLHDDETERIKEAFVKYNHPRFMKAFSYHLPFGAKQAYRKQIKHLNLDKLAHLIKICGFLLQSKIYLFWEVEIDKSCEGH